MAHMGVESERIHFSWVSSAESTKFVRVVKEVTEAVRALGPNRRFVKSDSLNRQAYDEEAA
jgi:coenzyme F420-reducing hydrogenase delta subunit